jgi:hypothetical protein
MGSFGYAQDDKEPMGSFDKLRMTSRPMGSFGFAQDDK